MQILEEAGLDTTEELGRGRIAVQQPEEKSTEEIAEEAWEEFGQELVEQADENDEDVDDDIEREPSEEPEDAEYYQGELKEAIREYVEENGPSTSKEIGEALGRPSNSIATVIGRIGDMDAVDTLDNNGKGRPPVVYDFVEDDGEDVDDGGGGDASDAPEEDEQVSEDVEDDIREMIETGRHTHGEIAKHLDVDIDRVELVHRDLDEAEPNDQPGVEEEETSEDPQQDDEDDEPTVQEKRAERILGALREHGALSAQDVADEADLKYPQTFHNLRNNTDLLDDVEQKPDPESDHWNAKLYYLPDHEDVDEDQSGSEEEETYEDECVECGTEFKANTYEGLQDVLKEHQCEADDGGGDQGKPDGEEGEPSQSPDGDDAGDNEPEKRKGPKIDIACRDCNRMFQSDEEYEEHDCPAEEDGGAREERQRRDRIKELADGA